MEVVYWDLETTGLDAVNKHVDVEILEIGAIASSGGEKFQQYLLPTAPIPRDASKVHNIYLKKVPGRRGQRRGYDLTKLYFKEDGRLRQVDAVDKKTGLKMFVDWLKGFDRKIVLAGYNNHNFDDWVLTHNLLQADMDVSGLGIQFGDVAKVVRPILNKEFDTKKWKLGFAVSCLLQRDQSLAHGALSDAEDARDLLIKLGEKQELSTKDILEVTLGQSDERLRALKDFDEVMKVCVKMFLSSGAGMARSVTREDRLKEKWKKHAEKKKNVQEQQMLTRKSKDTKSPKKLNPSKKCPKPLKNEEEETNKEQYKSNLQTKDLESKVLEIRNVNHSQLSEKSNEVKTHKSGLIMASDLPKRLPSNSSQKIAATLGQTKYQQTKINFKSVPKAIATQSLTEITEGSTKNTGSSVKPTRPSLTEITVGSSVKPTRPSLTEITEGSSVKPKRPSLMEITEGPSVKPTRPSLTEITVGSSVKPKRPSLTEITLSSINKPTVASATKTTGAPLTNVLISPSKPQQFVPKCHPKFGAQQHVELKGDNKIVVQRQVLPKCDPKISALIPDLECSIPLDEWDQSFQWDQYSIPLDEWDQSFKCDQSFQGGPDKGESSIQQAKHNFESSSITVTTPKQGMENLKQENEIEKLEETCEPFVVEKKLLNIEESGKDELNFKDKKVEYDDADSDSVFSKLASHFNNISVCDHKNESSDFFNDFGSECDENDDIFDSDLSDIIDEITGKKSL